MSETTKEFCNCLMDDDMWMRHKKNPGFCPFCGRLIHDWKLTPNYPAAICTRHRCYLPTEAIQQMLDHESIIDVDLSMAKRNDSPD